MQPELMGGGESEAVSLGIDSLHGLLQHVGRQGVTSHLPMAANDLES